MVLRSNLNGAKYNTIVKIQNKIFRFNYIRNFFFFFFFNFFWRHLYLVHTNSTERKLHLWDLDRFGFWHLAEFLNRPYIIYNTIQTMPPKSFINFGFSTYSHVIGIKTNTTFGYNYKHIFIHVYKYIILYLQLHYSNPNNNI